LGRKPGDTLIPHRRSLKNSRLKHLAPRHAGRRSGRIVSCLMSHFYRDGRRPSLAAVYIMGYLPLNPVSETSIPVRPARGPYTTTRRSAAPNQLEQTTRGEETHLQPPRAGVAEIHRGFPSRGLRLRRRLLLGGGRIRIGVESVDGTALTPEGPDDLPAISGCPPARREGRGPSRRTSLTLTVLPLRCST